MFAGTASFFVKHVQTGMCINDTRIIQSSNPDWGNVSFVELSNNCFDPAAQFRFRDNGAILNLKRSGCLFPTHKEIYGDEIDMLYLYVHSRGLDTEACAPSPTRNTDPAINQTYWGGLAVKYKAYEETTFQIWCVVPKTDSRLSIEGIDPYIGLTKNCNDAKDKRFNFGEFLSSNNFSQTKNVIPMVKSI